jgi:hypothetical protein
LFDRYVTFSITSTLGGPIHDTLEMTFKIFDAVSSGNELWSEAQTNVPIERGVFSVILGESTQIPDSVFSDFTSTWLELTLEGPQTLAPRSRITAVGYAYTSTYSDTAEYAQNAAADTDWVISGSDQYSGVSGNVGVGVTNPLEKIDFNGAINVSSSYNIGGDKVLSNAGTNNIFVGVGAGVNTTGSGNAFLGKDAGNSNTSGYSNTFLGLRCGFLNTDGSHNTFAGQDAGRSNTNGRYNAFYGLGAGYFNASGCYNTFLGTAAGFNDTTGTANTYVGYRAGFFNAGGDSNVFVGHYAGFNEIGSNKLIIANDSSDAGVLIYGEFDNRHVGIGTTNPEELLHVHGADDPTIKIQSDGVSEISGRLSLRQSNDTGFDIYYDGMEKPNTYDYGLTFEAFSAGGSIGKCFVIEGNTGNVGIGTDSPTHKLEINGGNIDVNDGIYYLRDATDSKYGIGFGVEGGGQMTIFTDDYLQFTESDNDAVVMTILGNDGHVGIGTTTPRYQLDVNGEICGGVNNRVFSQYGAILNGWSNIAGDSIYATDTASVVVGGCRNTSGGIYTFVGGGTDNSAIGSHSSVINGANNSVNGGYSTICGGYANIISGGLSVICGGDVNTAGGSNAFIGGGRHNDAGGQYSTISGGYRNETTHYYATIGGGENNTAGDHGSVGGGLYNTAEYEATVGGGRENAASAQRSTVAGGFADTVLATSGFATNHSSKVNSGHTNSAAFTGSHTTATLQVRAVAFSTGTVDFAMDHPDDPMNKILNQYAVSSDEIVSKYSGSVVLDARGRATVNLPGYFDDINRNPRIQLTGVGTSNIYVAEDVVSNRFTIGGKPNTKVYWEVTGERKDVHAELARMLTPVVQEKTGDMRGHSIDDDAMIGTYERLQKEKPGMFVFKTTEGRRVHEQAKKIVGSNE